MNKELLPFESESLSRKELNELIAVTEENGHIRKKHRSVLPIAAAIIAIATVSSVGVYAAVFKGVVHEHSVNNYYDSGVAKDVMTYDISELIEEQVSENEHLRVTVESVLTDDISLNMIVTLEALDERGTDYILHGKNGSYVNLPIAHAYDQDGELTDNMDVYYHSGAGHVEIFGTKSFAVGARKDELNGAEEIYIKLFEASDPEDTEKPEDIFTGIGFKVKTLPTIKTYTFVSDSGYEVRMSQYKFYHTGVPVASQDDPGTFYMHLNNGETEAGLVVQFGFQKFDVENIESIEYGKYTFYPKK